MSKQFDIKRGIKNLMENPEDKDAAVQLLLDAVELSEEEFEFENDVTPEEYLFG